jgi:adenylate cyclase
MTLGESSFSVKIGINSGPAMVGNVGTAQRYNYTAMGETVNVAARLESVPSLYACEIVIGPETAILTQDAFLLCELDTIRVKGREAPLAIAMPLALHTTATAAQRLYVRSFATALAHYRAMQFAEAAALWDALSPAVWDPAWLPRSMAECSIHPATVMAQRARAYATHPPETLWDGVWVLTSK